MKKNIWITIVALGMLGILGSCKKYLNLTPVSQANVESFYKTPTDIDNAVIAAYKYHKLIYSADFCSQHILDEWRSDNTGTTGLDVTDDFTKDTGKEWYMWSWDKCYKAIYMCNITLEKPM